MLTILLERKQSMSMLIKLAIITRNNITVERHQFQHSFNLLRLEATCFRDEHLQFGTTASSYT